MGRILLDGGITLMEYSAFLVWYHMRNNMDVSVGRSDL